MLDQQRDELVEELIEELVLLWAGGQDELGEGSEDRSTDVLYQLAAGGRGFQQHQRAALRMRDATDEAVPFESIAEHRHRARAQT